MAAQQDLIITRGKTFTLVIRWGTEPIVYKAITAIQQSAPVRITAVGHGLVDGWPVAVTNVKGMTEINAEANNVRDGDFHPANLLITPQGLVIIDWLDATVGNPLADLARSTLLIQAAVKNGSLRQPWLRWSVQLFQWILVREYFRLNPGGEKEFRRWLPLAAAARLSEHVPGEHDWLQTQVANSLLLA